MALKITLDEVCGFNGTRHEATVVSCSRLPTAERANCWIARRISFAVVRAKCLRHAVSAIGAAMLPRVDRSRVGRKKVVGAAHGSTVAAGTWANRLPVTSHCLVLLLRELLLVR